MVGVIQHLIMWLDWNSTKSSEKMLPNHSPELGSMHLFAEFLLLLL